jgi:Raf kinase inhibitor-like YbhB/YbcL family protein
MTLTSPAFGEGGTLPDVYSCRGTNESPPLAWTNVPLDAVELGIVVTDADANGYVHWAVAGLDPALIGIAQNRLPEGAIVAKNSDGSLGWLGPCPPGEFVHRYSFTLYALSQASGLADGAEALQAVATIAGLGEARATLTALYPAP